MVLKSFSNQFPGFDDVYLLTSGNSSNEFVGEMDLMGLDEFDLLRGHSTPLKRLQVKWAMGKAVPSDVIWTTLAIPVLFSTRVISILESNGFSGWSKYPVNVLDKNGNTVAGYYGISIIGRCGETDESRCERVNREFPGGVFPVYKGIYFDETLWDGADIFTSTNETGFVFVTGDVKAAFERVEIPNIGFEAVSAVERATL